VGEIHTMKALKKGRGAEIKNTPWHQALMVIRKLAASVMKEGKNINIHSTERKIPGGKKRLGGRNFKQGGAVGGGNGLG